MAATLSDLLSECRSAVSPDYAAKYLHDIPDAPVVDRAKYIVERCTSRRVLSLGASGPLEVALRAVDTEHFAVDAIGDGLDLRVNLDECPGELYRFVGRIDVVVAGEILEHLSNPGRLLDAVRELRVPVIVTAPNAFCRAADGWLAKNQENVNAEHVAWYSYRTLRTLLERHGFKVVDFAWYKGKPIWAEGLIFSVE